MKRNFTRHFIDEKKAGFYSLTVVLSAGMLIASGGMNLHAQEQPPPDDAPFQRVQMEAPQIAPTQADEAVPPAAAAALPVITGNWLAQGPGPSTNGQVENVSPNNEVVGAVHALAAHPTDPNVLYLGGVNGGVWQTTDGTAPSPTWKPLTDSESSLSIGALEFDPSDATHNTLWAGIGRFSSYYRLGGLRSGLLKTIDGGASWTAVDGGGTLTGKNISGVAPNGTTIVISVDFADSFTYTNIGIFWSSDGGASFTQISSGTTAPPTGLPSGLAYDLATNRNNPTVLYTSIVWANTYGGSNGVYRSTNSGSTWSKVSSPIMDAMLIDGTTSNVEISVGNSGAVNIAILNSGQLRNGGVFRSPSGALGTWVAMDVPLVNETGGTVGTNPRYKPEAGVPGGQGAIHFSILADAFNPSVLYVGGDRQPMGYNDLYSWPNALGANDYSGRLFRGDASQPVSGGAPSPQWKHLTHTIDAAGMPGGGTLSNSSPHADSREMVFDANENIIEGDDGGVYRRTNPGSNAGDWFSINGNLQVTEQHDVAYDSLSNIIISGNQDTGTTQQTASGATTWNSVTTADGGDVAVSVDPSNPAQSVRYSSYQYLGSFLKLTYDAAGNYITYVYPALTVISGAAFSANFVTPVEVNQVNSNRILLGGSNGMYESLDQGATITQVTSVGVNSAEGGNMMVYGGRSGGIDNADLVYAAETTLAGTPPAVVQGPKLAIRTVAAAGFITVTVASLNDALRGVITDPEEWRTVFTIDSDQVFMSIDTGTNWGDISGNLPTAFTAPDLRGIEFVRNGNRGAILVGTNQGVYAALDTNYTSWFKVGSGLPNAPVWDLDYDADDDVLIVATLGRGSWKLTNVADSLFNNSTFFWPMFLPAIVGKPPTTL